MIDLHRCRRCAVFVSSTVGCLVVSCAERRLAFVGFALAFVARASARIGRLLQDQGLHAHSTKSQTSPLLPPGTNSDGGVARARAVRLLSLAIAAPLACLASVAPIDVPTWS